MNEKNLITRIAALMPRHASQLNRVFGSDSEIVRGELHSIDEFSGEDRLCERDAKLLGWNIAVGAMSDIRASGGKPELFSMALAVGPRFDAGYAENFAEGVAEALRASGCAFVGGDFSRAKKEWRCCASVIGSAERPVTRVGAKAGDTVYVTGAAGGGCVQAAGKPYRFALRELPEGCTAAIDTSDGFAAAAATLAWQSACGLELSGIPYLPEALELCAKFRLPKEFLFFAECGEYELLFAHPDPSLPPQTFRAIGRVVAGSGLRLDGRDVAAAAEISARDFKSAFAYVWRLRKTLRRIFGKEAAR